MLVYDINDLVDTGAYLRSGIAGIGYEWSGAGVYLRSGIVHEWSGTGVYLRSGVAGIG